MESATATPTTTAHQAHLVLQAPRARTATTVSRAEMVIQELTLKIINKSTLNPRNASTARTDQWAHLARLARLDHEA